MARFDCYEPSVRPRLMFEYYVTGRGGFPNDMLRYDQCWPADTDSAFAMHGDGGQRSIRLLSYREPTIDRWLSFLWSVSDRAL